MSSVCLITEDVQRLAEFYEKVLQVKTEINDIHVNVPWAEGGFVIYSKNAAENQMAFDFTEYNGTGKTIISFFVDNADDEYERLKSLDMNIEFITAPTTYPWGSRSMHFRDLDGNIIGFISQKEKA